MTLSHQDLSLAIERLNLPLPVAELHGLCCGLLCSMSSAAAKTRWFAELLDAASLSANAVTEHAAQLKLLDDWFAQTLSSLNDADLDFSPALPEESSSAATRLRALSEFCAGFTYGIGIGLSQQGQKPLPKDSREIIADLQEIEGVEVNETEADEATLTELLEYVRVGVLLVLEELRPVSPITPRMSS